MLMPDVEHPRLLGSTRSIAVATVFNYRKCRRVTLARILTLVPCSKRLSALLSASAFSLRPSGTSPVTNAWPRVSLGFHFILVFSLKTGVVCESWSPASKLILELRMFAMYQYQASIAWFAKMEWTLVKTTARLLVALPCRRKDQGIHVCWQTSSLLHSVKRVLSSTNQVLSC